MEKGGSDIGVIFDCDGTLLDSMQVWHGIDDMLARLAGQEISQEDRDYMTRATIEECGALFHEKFGLGGSPQDVVGMISSEMLDFYEHRARPKPGALKFVQALAKAGVPMAVASSTPPVLLRKGIRSCGFEPYMEAVLSVDDFNTSKRRPLIFDKALEHLGTAKRGTWVFEDAVYALDTLRQAAYKSVGIYDNDISGTSAQLRSAADSFIMSFEDIDADSFLAMAQNALHDA